MIGPGPISGDVAQIDDSAVAVSFQMRTPVMSQGHRSDHVDAQHLLPQLRGKLVDSVRCRGQELGSIVHEDIEPPEVIDGLPDDRRPVARFAKVSGDCHGPPSEVTHQLNELPSRLGRVSTMYRHVTARPGKFQDDGAAHPLRAAGDQSYGPCEVHESKPLRTSLVAIMKLIEPRDRIGSVPGTGPPLRGLRFPGCRGRGRSRLGSPAGASPPAQEDVTDEQNEQDCEQTDDQQQR